MDWDGVAGKCVEDQNVKLLSLPTLGFMFKGQPRITGSKFHFPLTIPQVREIGAAALGVSDDIRIDLVVAQDISGFCEGCDLPRSESDYADSHGSCLAIPQHQ